MKPMEWAQIGKLVSRFLRHIFVVDENLPLVGLSMQPIRLSSEVCRFPDGPEMAREHSRLDGQCYIIDRLDDLLAQEVKSLNTRSMRTTLAGLPGRARCSDSDEINRVGNMTFIQSRARGFRPGFFVLPAFSHSVPAQEAATPPPDDAYARV